jgi:hypothetical protein
MLEECTVNSIRLESPKSRRKETLERCETDGDRRSYKYSKGGGHRLRALKRYDDRFHISSISFKD